MKTVKYPPLYKIGTALVLGFGIASTSIPLNDHYAFFNSLWPGLVGMCVASFYLIDLNAALHQKMIQQHRWPRHWRVNIIRALVAMALVSAMHAYAFDWLRIAYMLAFCACWFGMVFNHNLNKRRDLHPLYVGKPDKHDGLIDTIFYYIPNGGLWLLIVEVAGMIVSGYLYLKTV